MLKVGDKVRLTKDLNKVCKFLEKHRVIYISAESDLDFNKDNIKDGIYTISSIH